MSDVEKQEGQKTVVAFIAGLLIGGLLVWVFSSSEPAVAPYNEAGETTSEAAETTGATTNTRGETNTNTDSPVAEIEIAELPVGDGAIAVSDQAAGSLVKVDSASFPLTDGWIAIRDYNDGAVGGILGAARFSQSQGLVPTEVELLRATEAGMTYAAVFFTEDGSVNGSGSLYFDPANDQQIEGVVSEFTTN